VQAIDDEFLEWFVKNPSCEEVDVEHFGTCCGNQSITQCINCKKYNPVYKIIIPQELKSFSDFSDKFFGSNLKEEHKQTEIRYSEQEVLDLLYKRDLYLLNRDETKELELPTEWFEQFKKK
jgi:hypothetical protein